MEKDYERVLHDPFLCRSIDFTTFLHSGFGLGLCLFNDKNSFKKIQKSGDIISVNKTEKS